MDGVRSEFALKARYIFPVEGKPIVDGVISISGKRIVAVGENVFSQPPIDVGNVAIIPGLTNAHTHLEFSDLAAEIGKPGISFTEWIREVVTHRKRRSADTPNVEALRRRMDRAVRQGIWESVRSGVTMLGEIGTNQTCDRFPVATPIDCTVFRETIAFDREKADDAFGELAAWTDSPRIEYRRGLSPHAPYTVHPDLIDRMCRYSKQTKTPLAMHLAESFEELELLNSGCGPFVALLQDLDAWDASVIPRGISVGWYLKTLAKSHHSLVIHGNFLTEEEMLFIAAQAERMTVVYCPRTHAFFAHGQYPLKEMLGCGVPVAIGTDSKASNPDLNLLAEMCFVREHHPEVKGSEILRMGTLNGARALGQSQLTGSLASGKRADLALVNLSDETANDPHDLLLAESETAVRVLSGGRLIEPMSMLVD